jgi:hypothetical protein
MTFLVKVQNQGDQYVKVTGDAIEVHIKPGDSAEILAEDGASLAAVQETEEDAILAMTALALPDSPEPPAPPPAPAPEPPAAPPPASLTKKQLQKAADEEKAASIGDNTKAE